MLMLQLLKTLQCTAPIAGIWPLQGRTPWCACGSCHAGTPGAFHAGALCDTKTDTVISLTVLSA